MLMRTSHKWIYPVVLAALFLSGYRERAYAAEVLPPSKYFQEIEGKGCIQFHECTQLPKKPGFWYLITGKRVGNEGDVFRLNFDSGDLGTPESEICNLSKGAPYELWIVEYHDGSFKTIIEKTVVPAK
jgi:hypothetical protein